MKDQSSIFMRVN